MDFLNNINKIKDYILNIYGLIVFISSLSITGYVWYDNLLSSINNNTNKIELTQIMILKNFIKEIESNPCPISDVEWDNYVEQYTTLFDLQIKYKKIYKNAEWRPMKRITIKDDKCQK